MESLEPEGVHQARSESSRQFIDGFPHLLYPSINPLRPLFGISKAYVKLLPIPRGWLAFQGCKPRCTTASQTLGRTCLNPGQAFPLLSESIWPYLWRQVRNTGSCCAFPEMRVARWCVGMVWMAACICAAGLMDESSLLLYSMVATWEGHRHHICRAWFPSGRF